MLCVAAICVRAGVDEAEAKRAMVAAYPWPEDGPWAAPVKVNEKQMVVGQDNDATRFFCFPCPFPGVPQLDIPAFGSAADLLVLLGGPKADELEKV